jgi:hypothetical protein
LLERLRQEDHLSPGVQGQLEQTWKETIFEKEGWGIDFGPKQNTAFYYNMPLNTNGRILFTV